MMMSVNSVLCVPWDTCGNQWATFKELVISLHLVSEANSLLFLHCELQYSWAVSGRPHLSLSPISLCRTAGITAVYHYICSFHPVLWGSNSISALLSLTQ